MLPLALGLGVFAMAAIGCSDRVVERKRGVRLHSLPECPVPDGDALVDLEAFGDFPADQRSGEAPTRPGQRLLFPEDTRVITARTGSGSFFGLAETGAEGDADVLLWPASRPCRLGGSEEYPGPGGGRALGYHPGRGVVLVAGGDAGQTSAVVGALSFDAGTGDAELVNAAERHVLLEPRAFATAAPFGADLIVVGGEDPLVDAARRPRPVRTTAEVFSVDERRFLPDPVELRVARTRHRSGVLPSGEVLLVGGRRDDGTAVTALEAIHPETRRSSLGGLAHLAQGRVAPALVALDGGGWLVAGGLGDDGEPVGGLEWLSADASEHLGSSDALPGAYETTAVALPGGGALLVIGCGPFDEAEHAPCEPCARGCQPARRAFWLGPDRTLTDVALDVPARRPALVPAANGSAWLVTGEEDAPWYRFNPWRARFEPAEMRFGRAPVLRDPPLALDAGAFVWLEEEPAPHLRGLRSGLRHRFSRDLGLVQSTDPLDGGWPLSLAPSTQDAATYEPGALRLTATPVWLADVDFADVVVELAAEGGSPEVLLRGAGGELRSYGGESRPWPRGSDGEPPNARLELRLERSGERVSLWRGQISSDYHDGLPERVQIGFAGPPSPPNSADPAPLEVTLRSLRVERRARARR